VTLIKLLLNTNNIRLELEQIKKIDKGNQFLMQKCWLRPPNLGSIKFFFTLISVPSFQTSSATLNELVNDLKQGKSSFLTYILQWKSHVMWTQISGATSFSLASFFRNWGYKAFLKNFPNAFFSANEVVRLSYLMLFFEKILVGKLHSRKTYLWKTHGTQVSFRTAPS